MQIIHRRKSRMEKNFRLADVEFSWLLVRKTFISVPI